MTLIGASNCNDPTKFVADPIKVVSGNRPNAREDETPNQPVDDTESDIEPRPSNPQPFPYPEPTPEEGSPRPTPSPAPVTDEQGLREEIRRLRRELELMRMDNACLENFICTHIGCLPTQCGY